MPKILIADDEPDIVALVKRNLERDGFDVTTVDDGSKAIEICKKR